MIMKKKALIMFFILGFISMTIAQQRDSLRIFVQGLGKGEKYRVYYKEVLLREIHCKQNRCLTYFSIPFDKTIRSGDVLDLKIRKKRCIKYSNTFFLARYDSSKKFLIVFKNHRLKRRYALDAIWSDAKLLYED